MIGRRDVLGALLGAVGVGACGAARSDVVGTKSDAEPELKLDPIVDLVPAAGLVWLVEARPREMFADPVFAAALAIAAPDDRFETFARRHGNVDLRQANQLAIAGVGRATLGLATLPIAPGRVEAAFAARARKVDGRAIERGVTRFWGSVGEEREQVALFGRRAVGIERGGLGPLQAAIYFAQGRLKRALPALLAEPLAAATARLGAAPRRAFVPGPFDEDLAGGLGGLLRATTAAGARLRAQATAPKGAFALRVVLTGAWGAEADAAARRLAGSFRVLAGDPLGRLTGLDRPIEGPIATGDPEALTLDVTLDPVTLSRGVRAATDAPLAEIMAF
jgi:hypothetical protein